MKLPLLVSLVVGLSGCAGSSGSPTGEPTTSPSPAETPTPTSPAATTTPRTTPPPATPEPIAGEVILEIAVWDDTASNPPASDAEVWVRGEGSWYPDLSFGADNRQLGEYRVGEPGEFFIYPDGRSGVEIQVEFVMTADMVPISGSTQAQTVVEIHDSEVVVTGMAIPQLEETYSR